MAGRAAILPIGMATADYRIPRLRLLGAEIQEEDGTGAPSFS